MRFNMKGWYNIPWAVGVEEDGIVLCPDGYYLSKPAPDDYTLPDGTCCVSANHQETAPEKLKRRGFVPIVSWWRPDTGGYDDDSDEYSDSVELTWWQKPVVHTPLSVLAHSPQLAKYGTDEIPWCCGIYATTELREWDVAQLINAETPPSFGDRGIVKVWEDVQTRWWLVLPEVEKGKYTIHNQIQVR